MDPYRTPSEQITQVVRDHGRIVVIAAGVVGLVFAAGVIGWGLWDARPKKAASTPPATTEVEPVSEALAASIDPGKLAPPVLPPSSGAGFGNGHSWLGGDPRKRHARLVQGDIQVSGRLPPAVIARVIRQHFDGLRTCYDEGLTRDAKLAGSVTMAFVINADGSVRPHVALTPATKLHDGKVSHCIADSVATFSFPAPEGGGVNVEYTLVLEGPQPVE